MCATIDYKGVLSVQKTVMCNWFTINAFETGENVHFVLPLSRILNVT